MIVRRKGGLTEFIPSPQEKREGVLRDYALELFENLDTRLRSIEEELGLSSVGSKAFTSIMARIRREESETSRINHEILATGINHEEMIES
jgi:hypothetical protein